MQLKNTKYGIQTSLSEDDINLHIEIVQKMAQAAVSLEEFTIPLYMCSMYSLVGTHQITSSNAFYRGVWYPGNAITTDPDKWVYDAEGYDLNSKIPLYEAQKKKDPNRVLFRPSNNKAFNLIYKVFIEEMFHLQMAANLAKILGVNPDFTNEELVDEKSYAWQCFDADNTVIPYVVDLRDTKSYKDIKVTLGPLDHNQINLFLAIEAPEDQAKKELGKNVDKYFPDPAQIVKYYQKKGELPLMGSIGHLYQSLWDFLHLKFDTGDGQICLLDKILADNDSPYYQRELFNQQSPGHPIAEYPGVDSTVYGDKSAYVFPKIESLINAITEQGEGKEVAKKPKGVFQAVAEEARVSRSALKRNYTAYDDEGNELPISPRVSVRAGSKFKKNDGGVFDSTSADHDEVFEFIRDDLMQRKDFMTWDQWHAKGNKWSEDLIMAKDYDKNGFKVNLPEPSAIAAAMNRLKSGATKENPASDKQKAEDNYNKMCQVSTGAIWGIIHVLNNYWNPDKGASTLFPFPAMTGTGDRMSICWSIFGKVPDLSVPISKQRDPDIVNHACQGFAAMYPKSEGKPGSNSCAEVAIFHSCKGSNLCKAEGGCGFVHKIGGGASNCSSSMKKADKFNNVGGMCGGPQKPKKSKAVYSPPADNACGGQGGCAVPISASQLYPRPAEADEGKMQVHDYQRVQYPDACGLTWGSVSISYSQEEEYLLYKKGAPVYDIAWDAFKAVLQHRGVEEDKLPEKPEPTDIRLAFPPST